MSETCGPSRNPRSRADQQESSSFLGLNFFTGLRNSTGIAAAHGSACRAMVDLVGGHVRHATSYRYRAGCLCRSAPPPTAALLRHTLLICGAFLAMIICTLAQGNGTYRFHACLDAGHTDPLSEEAVSAGFKAAGRHIEELNCSYVTDCDKLLAAPVSFTAIEVSSKSDPIAAALAAKKCESLGGNLFVANAGSTFQTVIPYNVANRVATVVAEASGIPVSLRDLVIMPYNSNSASVPDLYSVLRLFGWKKIAVLRSRDDHEFVVEMESYLGIKGLSEVDYLHNHEIHFRSEDGMETKTFSMSIGSDLGYTLSEVVEFGASIIAIADMPFYTGGDGNVSSFDKFYNGLVEYGLMEPKYTWIGVHEMKRPIPAPKELENFNFWQQQLLYLEAKPFLSPLTSSLYAEETDFSKLTVNAGDYQEYSTAFAYAYDAAWMAAVGFSQNPVDDVSENVDSTIALPLWGQDLGSKQFKGLTGTRVLNDLFTDRVSFDYELQLSQFQSGKHEVIGTVVCKDCKEPELQFALGVSALPWRDGTNYPSSIPEADISIKDGDSGNSSFVMISIITIGVILIILLMFVGLGYFRIHSHLKQVAAADIDIESPIAKAISLLKEFSTTWLVSASGRRKALATAMALLSADNVHAPMLQNESVDKTNRDIMKFLMFNSESPGKSTQKNTRGSAVSSEGGSDSILITGHRPSAPANNASILMEKKDQNAQVPSDESVFDLEEMEKSLAAYKEILEHAGTDLFFDTLKFVQISGTDRPLVACGIQVVRSFNLKDTLYIDEAVLASFIAHIEEGYNNLPYHNAIHAADVLVRVSAIIHADTICDPKDTKDALLLLSVILSAIVHDYNHPGLTNAFQIAIDSAISREFNEQMILENVSLHRSLAAMRQDRFNFLPAMSAAGKRELCSNIIKLVLATDMSRHFELVASFKSKILTLLEDAKPPALMGLNAKRRGSVQMRGMGDIENGRLHLPPVNGPRSPIGEAMGTFDSKQKIAVLQMALKVADVGHMAAHFEAHAEWSRRLEDEFFNQGDKERDLNIEISPLMDREKPGVTDPNNQLAFANIIVIPMMEGWERAAVFSGSKLLKEVHKNQGMWQKTRDRVVT